ncbi:SDR family NAD(P)-dependent oxidoreductase [Pedobacter insulae]|uniref:NAD(P)-dependent dehydrogenase, short-chain alcohol dehydrogenase family n=1 Tax=Pedobacter insulae TaxID=414048 RepID=A0A1I2X7P5_9SPHI|nr:SDR family oxidoreductase [Pedobacter insulae]SFH09047.1 NAD(P)-dependent dehydrogenase, short-chain alcohol dehydrogenase family [Pedobacter insulae]
MQIQKIALVTGGSRGLGKNMALALAKKGIDVILTYQSKKTEADEVVSTIELLGQQAIALQFDAGNVKSFDSFIAKVKEVLKEKWEKSQFDFLINNAGIGINVPFADTTEDQFDLLNAIQFKGVYFLTQQALPILADQGRIINLATGLTRFTLPGYSAYAAMKGAIEIFTKYLAKELGPRKIAANVVAPGAIETDFGGGVVRDNEQMNAIIASNTALGRVGLPDDIGGVIAFLCSEEGRWINGQRIEVSGGQFI